MRVLRHFIPLDNVARTVRTEHGIRRIFHIGGRVVGGCRDDFLRVVAGCVAVRCARQPTASLGVRRNLGPVVAHGGNRRRSGQNRAVSTLLGRLERAVHSLNVGHGASDALVRQLQPEDVIRLEQQALGAHQAVADGAVGRLAEVTAFRVLDVSRPARMVIFTSVMGAPVSTPKCVFSARCVRINRCQFRSSTSVGHAVDS